MKVLLATDGTKYSDSAIEMVGNLDIKQGDEIKIISVVDMAIPLSVDVYASYLPDTTELEKAIRENAKQTLEKASAALKQKVNDGVKINTEILFGTPESRIVEYAEEMNADLIIVGSHGYNRWERLLLGSVSNSVVHHAHCSVIVVRGL